MQKSCNIIIFCLKYSIYDLYQRVRFKNQIAPPKCLGVRRPSSMYFFLIELNLHSRDACDKFFISLGKTVGDNFTVFVRGLRTKIAVTVAILLFLGMFLIDLVTMVTLRRELIRSEVLKANTLLAFVEDNLLNSTSEDGGTLNSKSKPLLTRMINGSQIADALVVGSAGEQIYLGPSSAVSSDKLARLTQKAVSSGNKTTHFEGTGWGIFGKQKNYLILSAPLTKNKTALGGISIVLPLARVYQTLKNTQQILFIYIFVNLAILTAIGIYRISKLYLQPLARLAKRAEDYKDDDDILFSVRK